MITLNEILGHASDPGVARKLHKLSHSGGVEYVTLSREDALRHRLRVTTDLGTECAIALPRTMQLADGAVLLLEADRAVVVRLLEREWLTLAPRDAAAALELGYFAGNSHWTVRFDGPLLGIALQGPEQSYIDRLAASFSEGRVTRVQHG